MEQSAFVTIDADITSTATGGITSYDWVLGGGTWVTTGDTSRRWRAPGTDGNYTVILTVTDANGSASDTITLNVPDTGQLTTVTTALPTVGLSVGGDAGAISVGQLSSVTISADITSVATGGITDYTWRLDGGTFTSSGNTSRRPTGVHLGQAELMKWRLQLQMEMGMDLIEYH